MLTELRAKIRRMIENETRPTNLPPSAYWTLAAHVKQLLDELDKDEKADPTATAWLDLVRGPSVKVEYADEHVPGDAYVLSYPGAKDGIMWQADCSCGQYHTAPYATPEIAREVAKNHADAKNTRVAPGDRVRHKSTGAVGMVGVGTHWKDASRHLVHWNSTRPSTFETNADLEKI